MKRPWQIWLLFLLCLSIVYPGLGWLTVLGLRLDRDETSARRQAEIAKGEAEQARQQAELQDLVGKSRLR